LNNSSTDRELRPPLAILNELSLQASPGTLSEEELESQVDSFVTTLRAARRIRRDLALVSQHNISALPIGENGLTLAAFLERRGGRSRELLRFIRVLMNHAPIASAPSLRVPDDGEEYACQGQPADGLGFAAANRQLATSMGPIEWPDPSVEVERNWLDEKDEEAVLREETLHAVHASTAAHVEEHEHFIRQIRLPPVLTGEALWRDREQLFPNLLFLPRVEAQFAALSRGSGALESVLDRLLKLDGSVQEWDPHAQSSPTWGSLVTPEHEQRKPLCVFRDVDGIDRCFDLHARYTPGPGRIHFRLDAAAERRIIVAYVGRKIGI